MAEKPLTDGLEDALDARDDSTHDEIRVAFSE